jgi:alpha 1,3-glucosidase
MKNDPFTLRVALDGQESARGELYLDDGESFSYRDGDIIWREFLAHKPDKNKKVLRISSRDLVERHPGEAVDAVALTRYDSRNTFVKSVDDVRVERVVVVGLSSKPKSVKVEGGKDVEWHFAPGVSGSEKKDGVASVLTMKDPNVAISRDWDIVIQM